jgi:arginine deiminase
MHEPSDELFPGVMHPRAALFADYIDVRKADEEHRTLRQILTECGMEVRTVRELLLKDTMDAHGDAMEGKALDELRRFASEFLEYEGDGSVDEDLQQPYKESILNKAHPEDLVRTILNRPKVVLRATETNTGMAADYTIRPMMNLMFMRDQMIVTPKGAVIGRLHSPQRIGERHVAEFCLNRLGIKPIFRLRGETNFLEGGDYIYFAGDTSFIGCGMRTSRSAIGMLLDNDVFGTDRVVVVRDSLHWQAQMHLDTYFGIIDEGLAVLSENRLNAMPEAPEFLTVDVYVRKDNGYVIETHNKPFTELLADMGYDIIPVPMEDSMNFGANFVTVAPRKIVATAGQSAAYVGALANAGVEVIWVALDNCTKGYGAAHCLTQVL